MSIHQRSSYLDFVKGIAIILVVFAHSIQYGNGSDYLLKEEFFNNPCFIFIYSFHMPLFMLISGYLFFNSTQKYKLGQLWAKKLRSIGIPIISFGIIKWFSSIIHLFQGDINYYNFARDFYYFLFLNYHAWFLWSILLNATIVIIVRKFNDSFILYVLFEVGLLFIPEKTLPGVYSFMYPFFVLGYLTNKSKVNNYWVFHSSIIIGSSILFIILLLFYNSESYVYNSGQYIFRESGYYYLILDTYRLIIGLIGSISFLSIVYASKVYKINSILTKSIMDFGKLSLGIYCFQELFFFIGQKYFASINAQGVVSTLNTFVLGFGLSYILTKVAMKCKIIKYVLFGG